MKDKKQFFGAKLLSEEKISDRRKMLKKVSK